MNRVLYILLLIVITLACTQITQGIIVRKDYSPEFTTMQFNCISRDSYGNCLSGYMYPYTYPAEYTFCMRDNTQDKPVNEQDQGCVDVDPGTFSQYNVGDQYPRRNNG